MEPVQASPGVVGRALVYSKDLVCIENTFEKEAMGSLHYHPHTQVTYMVDGELEFSIDGERKIIRVGDAVLKLDGVGRGRVCEEVGTLLDVLNPMREDFVSVL